MNEFGVGQGLTRRASESILNLVRSFDDLLDALLPFGNSTMGDFAGLFDGPPKVLR